MHKYAPLNFKQTYDNLNRCGVGTEWLICASIAPECQTLTHSAFFEHALPELLMDANAAARMFLKIDFTQLTPSTFYNGHSNFRVVLCPL